MTEHSCRVNGNSLIVTGDFSTDTDTGFDDACQKLLSVSESEVIADLTAATRICSTYVGLLAELCLNAKNCGKELTIRSGQKINRVLTEAGLDHAANLQEIG